MCPKHFKCHHCCHSYLFSGRFYSKQLYLIQNKQLCCTGSQFSSLSLYLNSFSTFSLHFKNTFTLQRNSFMRKKHSDMCLWLLKAGMVCCSSLIRTISGGLVSWASCGHLFGVCVCVCVRRKPELSRLWWHTHQQKQIWWVTWLLLCYDKTLDRCCTCCLAVNILKTILDTEKCLVAGKIICLWWWSSEHHHWEGPLRAN